MAVVALNLDMEPRYFPAIISDFTDQHCWDCIKKNQRALLPLISEVDDELELKNVTEDAKESLIQLICCFKTVTEHYTEAQLNPQRVAHILLQKLPQAFQMWMVTKCFKSFSVSFNYHKAQDYMNWILLLPLMDNRILGITWMQISSHVPSSSNQRSKSLVPCRD